MFLPVMIFLFFSSALAMTDEQTLTNAVACLLKDKNQCWNGGDGYFASECLARVNNVVVLSKAKELNEKTDEDSKRVALFLFSKWFEPNSGMNGLENDIKDFDFAYQAANGYCLKNVPEITGEFFCCLSIFGSGLMMDFFKGQDKNEVQKKLYKLFVKLAGQENTINENFAKSNCQFTGRCVTTGLYGLLKSKHEKTLDSFLIFEEKLKAYIEKSYDERGYKDAVAAAKKDSTAKKIPFDMHDISGTDGLSGSLSTLSSNLTQLKSKLQILKNKLGTLKDRLIK